MKKNELKILMIGNSFSICVGKNLPQIVHGVPDCSLELTSAYIGGCPLDVHSAHLEKAGSDPEFKPYLVNIWKSSTPDAEAANFYASVNELLENNQYDIVTIQQASHKSWDENSYQPYADHVIDFIRKHQKHAEIMVQQTWSYRCDHSYLQPNADACWEFDQTGMYERLKNAYRKFAESKGFRMIPCGDAVQVFRKRVAKPFKVDSRKFDYPELPSSAGDVVGVYAWYQDQESNEWKLGGDRIHLNPAGEYLQGCVWFAILFGKDVSEIVYDSPLLGKEECAFLRECAGEAVRNFIQVER